MVEKNLFSVSQVAILLKIHPLTVRRYIKEGKLQALKAGGNVRVPQSSINKFTHQISASSYGVKKEPMIKESRSFEPTDPIFRLKGRGISLKAIK